MSTRFAKDWETSKRGIRSVIKPTVPLRQKIDLAIRRVEAQIQYLEGALHVLSERDKALFSKVVDAYSKHEIQRAHVFANELAELRKMVSFMMNAELALERVVLRLRTVTQLGNVVVALGPATKVLQSVSTGVAGVLPNAELELGEIGRMLNDIMIEAGQTTGETLDFEVAGDDAKKILTEAAMIAEQKMKEKFPELPTLKASEEYAREAEYTNY